MTAPDVSNADRVDELCRTRDLLAAIPHTGGFVDRAELAGLLRDRIDQLTWGENPATATGH